MRYDQEVPHSNGAKARQVGPETSALLEALSRVIDAQFDAAVIQDPAAFAQTSQPKQVTPGSPEKLVKNESGKPMMVHVRVEVLTTAQTGYLFLAKEAAKATPAKATRIEFGEAPQGKLLLMPNESCWCDVTSPDSSGTALTVVYSAVILEGRDGVFRGT